MRVLVRFIGVAVALLAGAIALAACGGGGDGGNSDLETYFQEMATLGSDFNQRGTELDTQYDIGSATTDEERVRLTRSFLQGAHDALEEFVGGMDELEAPDETAEVHGRAIADGRKAIASLQTTIDQIEPAATQEELLQVVNSYFAAGSSFETFSRSCVDLQDIADAEEVAVDLSCGE